MLSRYHLGSKFLSNFKKKEANQCWEWRGQIDHAGYGCLWIDSEKLYAHRVAFEHFRYPIFEGAAIKHKCKNRACVNPFHLRMQLTATGSQGGSNWQASLKEEDIKVIRQRAKKGEDLAAIARDFGVKRQTIWSAVKRVNWKHVD